MLGRSLKQYEICNAIVLWFGSGIRIVELLPVSNLTVYRNLTVFNT